MVFGIEILNFVALLALNMIEIYCIHLFVTTFFEFLGWAKKRMWIYYLSMVGFYGLLTGVNLVGELYLNMFITVFVSFAPALIFTNRKSIKGYVFLCANIVAAFAYEGLVYIALGEAMTDAVTYNEAVNSPYTVMILMLLKFVTAVLICHMGARHIERKYNKVVLAFLVVPISSLMMLYSNLVLTPGRELNTSVRVYGVISAIIMLLGNVLVFAAIDKYASKSQANYELKERNLKLEAESDILEVAAKSMKERLASTEAAMERDRVMRHDRRHFEGLILSLLNEGNSDEAKKLLEQRLKSEPVRGRRWCDNTTVNATLDYYIAKAESEDIKCNVETNIPDGLNVGDLDLAIAIGNLVENAIHACKKVNEEARFIRINAIYKRQLLIEIENSCNGEVIFDEDGYPITERHGHGVGTKSVLAFADKTGSQIFYSCNDCKFRVRMIIG